MLRKPLGFAALGCALLMLLLGVHFTGSDGAGPWDAWASAALHSHLPDALSIALVIDFSGEPLGAAVLAGLLAVACLLARRWRLAVLAVTVQGVVGGATHLLKPVFDRTIHDGDLAYPSGHTAGATALALALALLVVDLLRVGRPIALLLVFGVVTAIGTTAALAQIWLVAHYASDTIGGFCLALAVVPPLALLIDRTGDRIVANCRPAPDQVCCDLGQVAGADR